MASDSVKPKYIDEWVWSRENPRCSRFSKAKMAGISFLDLMFAEALASGLAREAARAEKPPDNFFLIPPDPRAWRQIQEASKKENMVIAIEITENSSMNCKRMQQVFMDLAREIEGIPFLRVQVGPGGTYEEVGILGVHDTIGYQQGLFFTSSL